MQKDFEFMKEILESVANCESPIFHTADIGKDLFGKDFLDDKNIAHLYLHIQLLCDTGCITNLVEKNSTISTKVSSVQKIQKNYGFSTQSLAGTFGSNALRFDERILTTFKYSHEPLRLTNAGYDLLDSLSNNKVMEEIKKSGGKITIESLIGVASSIGSTILSKSLGL